MLTSMPTLFIKKRRRKTAEPKSIKVTEKPLLWLLG